MLYAAWAQLENVLPPEKQWPAGGLNCYFGLRDFDPLLHKKVYTVGVHAPAGIDTAWQEFNLTFQEYLDRTVGDRFVPPIRFQMKPSVDPLRDWVDHENGEDTPDFMYSDTGLYSCIGVEIGGQPIGTTISYLSARGRSYTLDIYGGTFFPSQVRCVPFCGSFRLFFYSSPNPQGALSRSLQTQKSTRSMTSKTR